MKKHLTILIITLAVVSTALADMEFRSSSDIQVYSPFEMNNNQIEGLQEPDGDSNDALTLGYANEQYLSRNSQDSLGGNLDADGNEIFNLPTPEDGSEAATKNYVDTEISTSSGVQDLSEVLEEGPTANQSFSMDGNTITNLPAPTASNDSVNREWVQVNYVASSGGRLTGDLTANSNTIRNLAPPNNSQDAATKSYVDSELGNNTGNLSQVLQQGSTANQSIKLEGNITSGSNEMCLGDAC